MHAEIAHARPKKRLITRWWFWVDWGDGWHRRHRMADWMVLTHSLVGLTRSEVVAKLGEPPPTDYFKDWSMVYILGSERGFISIDSEWLVLRIDAGGRVGEVKIVHD
jgi:hypothetical protein